MPKSTLETLIDKVTNENNVTEDWGLMMEIVDEINHQNLEKEAIRLFVRKMNDKDPHVISHAITLLNACVSNCSRLFKLEVCSRVFTEELKNFIIKRRFPQLSSQLAGIVEKWSNDKEFKSDPALNLIPTLYVELKKNGVEFTQPDKQQSSKKDMKSNLDELRKKEEEDLAKAIQLSLKESSGSSSVKIKSNGINGSGGASSSSQSNGSSSLFGSLLQSTQSLSKSYNDVKVEKRKVKALYDFEAVEDNEITFKAGDVLYLIDDSDPNWWKGSSLSKDDEGLFPSNFVTFDLSTKVVDEYSMTNGNSKKVTFNDKLDINAYDHQPNKIVKLAIDEKKIDDCIELLQNADPTGEIQPDTQELLELEDQCYMMGPLIDTKLQKIDQKHAVLEDLNLKILEAFQVYNNLMKESISKTTNLIYSPSAINQLNSLPSSVNNPILNNNPQSQISYAAAPPTLDTSSMLLANQLNSLGANAAMYNMPMNTSQQQQQQQIPQMYQMPSQQQQTYSVPSMDPMLSSSSSQGQLNGMLGQLPPQNTQYMAQNQFAAAYPNM